MKRIKQYFYGACIAFTATTVILSILHSITHKEDLEVKSLLCIFLIILFIQIVLYLTENIQIRSPAIHMAIELFVSLFAAFGIGIPTGLFSMNSKEAVIEVIFIITAAYGITILSLYTESKKDAEEINRRLAEKR